MRLEVDDEEVVVDGSSHAMKTRAFATLNLRATRQPQALNRHGGHTVVFSPAIASIFLKRGGELGEYKRAVMG